MKINFKKFSVKITRLETEFPSGNSVSETENFLPVFLMSLALFLMVSFGPQFVNFVKALTSGVSLTATVASTLTFTMDASSKGLGNVTAGTPVFATSSLYIITNNASGSNTTINRASSTATLFIFSGGATTTIADTPNGNNWTAPAATGTTPAGSAVWTIGTTKGLGFRVVSSATDIGSGASTTCGAATAWWGATDGGAVAKWSGISTSTPAQKIADCGYFTTFTGQTVLYQLDPTTTQAGGAYQSSPITFTVVVNL